MANIKTRQNKLQKIGYSMETTVDNFESMSAATDILAVENVSFAVDRGTGLISRSTVNHGWATSLKGAVGTRAATLSYDMEMHASGSGGSEVFPHFARVLTACGMVASGSASACDIYPSTKEVSDFTSFAVGTNGPFSISQVWVENNNGTADTYIPLKGCQGTPTFSFATGERAIMSINWHGNLETTGTYMNFSDVDYAQNFVLGDAEITGNPLVVKGVTCTIKTDSSSGSAYSDLQVSALTLNSNFELLERQTPCATNGFKPSMVVMNTEPTVTFNIAENDSIDNKIWTDFAEGAEVYMSFTFTFENTEASTLQLVCPRVQIAELGLVDSGFRDLAITGRCVGTSGNPDTDATTDKTTRSFYFVYTPAP